MKKIIIIAGISLLALLVLLTGAALIMNQFVNPNKFKGRISQFVYAKTGQVLVLNGDMHWSVFPWIGLKAEHLVYYNPPSFSPKSFISAKEMDIKVKLMPLLTGKIEVGNITLNNATLNLIKNKNGQYNWQALSKSSDRKKTSTEASHSKAISNLTIGSLKIKKGKLNWYNEQTHTHTTIDALNISSKSMQLGSPFPINLQFNLLNYQRKKQLTFDLESKITISPDHQRFTFNNSILKASLFTGKDKLNFNATGQLEANLEKYTAHSQVKYHLNDMNGELNLIGQNLDKAMHFTGLVSTNKFNLKKALSDSGKNLDLKNKSALTMASLISHLDMTKQEITFSNLHAQIDDTDVYGKITYHLGMNQVNFSLNANQLALDKYLKDSKTNDQTAMVADKATAPLTKKSAFIAKGIINIDRLEIDKLHLTHVVTNLFVTPQLIKFDPLRANFYQGQLNGLIAIENNKSDQTSITLKQAVNNVNLANLLHDYSNADKLIGTADLLIDLKSKTSQGINFINGLNGKVNISIKNGALNGLDIIYQLSRAHAFLKHLPTPSMADTKQTTFHSLTAEGKITNGLLTTDNLLLMSDYLKVTGKGTTNLTNNDIHYRLQALAQPRLANSSSQISKEFTTYQVPIKIGGKITKPSVNLDFVALAKAVYTQHVEKAISSTLKKGITQVTAKNYSPTNILKNLANTLQKQAEQKIAKEQ